MQFADPEVTIPAKAARFKARVAQAIDRGMVARPASHIPEQPDRASEDTTRPAKDDTDYGQL